jgi:hypothetical protein
MNLLRIIGLAVTLVTISGCATFGQLEEGLNALVGRNEREAFNALGYPNGKQQFGDDTVYVWGRSSSGTLFIPQTSQTTGYVGTTPVYGTTTTTQAIPVNYSCTIKIIVGADSVIRTWEYDGNLGGCSGYIQRVNEYVKRK